MGKGSNVDLVKDDLYVAEEEITTHEEARPVPLLTGTRKVALGWISSAMNMVLEEAPNEVPGKK